MKRIKAIVILIVMLTTGFFNTNITYAEKQFSDISGHWAKQSIIDLNKYGMISGYSDGTFKPDATVSRAELIAWLTRIMKHKMGEEKYQVSSTKHDTTLYKLSVPMSLQSYYEDYAKLSLPNGYWAKQAIEEGKWLGILPYMGIGQKKLYLNKEDYYQPITRGEVAYCVTRAARYFKDEFPEANRLFFSYIYDKVKDIHNSWEYPLQCQIAYIQGFFGGYGDNTFKPEKPITRAETTTVLMKLLEPNRANPFRLEDKSIQLEHLYYMPTWENGSTIATMKPDKPMTLYAPYYRLEDKVVYEVFELAKIMEKASAEMHNYAEGGYRRFSYNNKNGMLSISFSESYEDYKFALDNNEYLKDTVFGDFSMDMGYLRNSPIRDNRDNMNGCIYEFKLNPHWQMLKKYHWDTIKELCEFLFAKEADVLLNKIIEHSKKSSSEFTTDYFYLNNRKVIFKVGSDGILVINIEIKQV
ncbi:S-layer homology domain-containing protein [Clostridium sp. 'deep sea']|uniref:S-layer homology domain-containing protein n=1 Tax=Clostridium sp. 'deep sea' TaxID=2779445 RepID=UPI00189652BE|nr:S-layer homology domain-containing protein [Clostridium sp. 'deep sea']QOR34459.1 S-layer homology domain-containing protein [Clostridium sp. 'deep sea']